MRVDVDYTAQVSTHNWASNTKKRESYCRGIPKLNHSVRRTYGCSAPTTRLLNQILVSDTIKSKTLVIPVMSKLGLFDC